MNPAPTARPSTSQHTPGVNYHATSERIRYADLSPAVREAADAALGSPVVAAAPPVTSGFTNAYAGGVLLRDGRQAFLKASGPEFPFPVLSLGREAQVLEALGEQIPAVPMIGRPHPETAAGFLRWTGSRGICQVSRGRTMRSHWSVQPANGSQRCPAAGWPL